MCVQPYNNYGGDYMLKTIRIDVRLTENENNDIELLKNIISMNRTDTICKAIKFCLIHRKEFKKYGE